MDERSERVRDVAETGNGSVCAFTARLIEVLHISGSARLFYHFRIMTGSWGQEAWRLGKENVVVEKSSGCFRKLKRMEISIVLSCGYFKGFEGFGGFGGIECICANENAFIISTLNPLPDRDSYFVQVKLCCKTARIANCISRSRGCV